MTNKTIDYSKHSFLWYDYETFGLSARHDRVAQFAAIRTDMQLRPIGKPIMLYCQPAVDYLPQPQACLLTGITPQVCQQNGVSEQEFAATILAEMAQPNTISVGYNSIRFDDEFTRFLLWRNLHDSYAREWQNGCGRWDLLDVVRLTYALRPEGINWPQDETGLPNFKLENLTKANQLQHSRAHDALSDVYATIAVARLIQQRQPKLFEFALQLHKKPAALQQIIGADGRGKAFVHISGQIARERGCMALMYPIARHPTNSNEYLAWDLAHDPSELTALSAEQLRQRLFTPTAQLPPGMTRLPLKGIHINKSPMVVGNLKILTAAVQQRWQINLAQVQANLAKIQTLPEMSAIWQQVFQRDAVATELDVDAALYQGFLQPEDKKRLDRLRQLTPDELAQQDYGFDDPRLPELVFRYRARNFPDSLTTAEQQQWRQHCLQQLQAADAAGLTFAGFSDLIDQLQQQLDEQLEQGSIAEAGYEQQQLLLEQLYDWSSQLQESLVAELPI